MERNKREEKLYDTEQTNTEIKNVKGVKNKGKTDKCNK